MPTIFVDNLKSIFVDHSSCQISDTKHSCRVAGTKSVCFSGLFNFLNPFANRFKSEKWQHDTKTFKSEQVVFPQLALWQDPGFLNRSIDRLSCPAGDSSSVQLPDEKKQQLTLNLVLRLLCQAPVSKRNNLFQECVSFSLSYFAFC